MGEILCTSPECAARLLDTDVHHVWELALTGHLEFYKVRNRMLIKMESIYDLIDSAKQSDRN